MRNGYFTLDDYWCTTLLLPFDAIMGSPDNIICKKAVNKLVYKKLGIFTRVGTIIDRKSTETSCTIMHFLSDMVVKHSRDITILIALATACGLYDCALLQLVSLLFIYLLSSLL